MKIILGPPGTGKTTYLLRIMEEAIEKGTPPEKIAFISFTRRAIREAKERVKKKFGLKGKSVANFRTLHSFAFRHLGLSTKNLMTKDNYLDLANVLGIDITEEALQMDFSSRSPERKGTKMGDRCLLFDGISRNTLQPIENIWEEHPDDDVDFYELERVAEGLRLYKQQYALLDYTDLLEKFVTDSFELSFDLLLIDEAQDLSALQWRVVHKIADKAKEAYVAGDDDQAIFRWAGADIEYFINLEGEVTVLSHSYRLPKEIHEYSQSLLKDIDTRRAKAFQPSGSPGTVQYIPDIEDLDFSQGSWLLLARSGYSLYPLLTYANHAGLYYSFKDTGVNQTPFCRAILAYKKFQLKQDMTKKEMDVLDAYRDSHIALWDPWWISLSKLPAEQILRYRLFEEAGEDFSQPPRIQFSTIHGSKGTEADNVVICPDISRRSYVELGMNPSDEARVFYVGVTRARKNLYILTPQTKYSFDL